MPIIEKEIPSQILPRQQGSEYELKIMQHTHSHTHTLIYAWKIQKVILHRHTHTHVDGLGVATTFGDILLQIKFYSHMADLKYDTRTHTQTYTRTYLCVCVCARPPQSNWDILRAYKVDIKQQKSASRQHSARRLWHFYAFKCRRASSDSTPSLGSVMPPSAQQLPSPTLGIITISCFFFLVFLCRLSRGAYDF